MTNADLTLRLLLKDEASSKLDNFGKQVKQALAVGAIAAFGVASVKAFADAEAAQAKLAFAFQKFPAMSNVALGALKAYNTELAAETAIDDDAIASGQAILAQFKLTGQQVQQVTPLLLDYAAATGRDVPDAASVLGKALLGNARALKEIGISYTATGDTAADFAAITDLLSQKVGGFAETFAQTAAGKLQEFNRQVGEIQETIGAALVPALTAANAALGPVLNVLGRMDGTTMAAAAALALVAVKARDIGPAVGRSVQSLSQLGAATKSTATGFGAIGESAVSNMRALSVASTVGTKAMSGLRVAGSGLLGVLGGPWGAALTAATAAVGILAAAHADGERKIATYTSALQSNSREQMVNAIAGSDFAAAAVKMGIDLALLTDAAMGNEAAMAAVRAQVQAYAEANRGNSAQNAVVATTTGTVTRELDRLEQAQAGATTTTQQTSAAMSAYERAAQQSKAATQALERAYKSLTDALSRQEARDAAIQAMRELRKQLAGTQEAFSGVSEAAIENRRKIRETIQAFVDVAEGMKSPQKQAQYLTQRIREIRSTMTDAGASGKEIERAVGPLIRVRDRAREAATAMDDLAGNYNVNLTYTQTGSPGRRPHATGGPVVGPGGPTDDAVPAMLSNGEYVIRASSVKRYGLAFLDAVNSGRAVGLRRGGRANSPQRGGAVGRSPGQSADAAREWADSSQQERQQWWREQMQGLADAADEAKSVAQAAYDALQSFREGFRAQASVTTHVFGDVEGAESSVFDARRAYNQALGTEREAEALERLNAAKKAAADAKATRTPQAVLATVTKKLQTMRQFVGDLSKMRDMGYPASIVRDVLGQGLEAGAEMARVLATADAATVRGFQSAAMGIDAATSDLAGFTPLQGNYDTAMANMNNANATRDYYGGQPIQVSVVVDGRKIVEALQDYKRSIGNAPLGLS